MLDTIISFVTNNIIFFVLGALFIGRFLFATRGGAKFEEYPGNHVKAISSLEMWNSFMEESEKSNRPVVIDFYATWCPPCRRAAPIFGKMSTELEHVDFVKVDVDALPQISKANGVSAMPTFLIFHQGMKVDEMIGWSEQSLRSKLAKIYASSGGGSNTKSK